MSGEGTLRRRGPGTALRAHPWLALNAACALAAAGAHLAAERGADVPLAVHLAAAPLLLGGAAAPLLMRAAPGESSRAKLLTFAALGSVPLVALLALGLAPRVAPLSLRWPLALAALALLQAVGFGCRVTTVRPGRAFLAAAALAAASGSAVAWVLFGGGDGALLGRPEAQWHGGVAEAWLRPGPLEHPWLAGARLPASPALGAWVAAVSGALAVAAPWALGASTVLAAILVPLLVYWIAAAVHRSGALDVLAVLLGWLGWNATAGLASLAGLGSPATAGHVADGGAALLAAGALPIATALALGALAAGVHAVRHGEGPWPFLTAAFAGLAALVDVAIGAAAGAAAILAGLSSRSARARYTVAPLTALALIPAAAALGRYGAASDPVTPAVRAASFRAFLEPAALLALPLALLAVSLAARRARRSSAAGTAANATVSDAPFASATSAGATAAHGASAYGTAAGSRALGTTAGGTTRRGTTAGGTPEGGSAGSAPGGGDRRAAAILVLLAALAPLAVAAALPGGMRRTAALGAFLAWPLAVASAGALGRLWRRGRPERAAAITAAALLAAGGLAAQRVAFRSHAALARSEAPLEVAGRRVTLEPRDPFLAATRACYEWIAGEGGLAERRAVLVRSVTSPAGHRVGGPTAPHLAPLATGLPMWWDQVESLAVAGRTSAGDDWKMRADALAKLFTERYDWDVNVGALLRAQGRPIVLVVDEHDRRATSERGTGPRGIDARLLQLGAREVFSRGDVSVYRLDPEAPR